MEDVYDTSYLVASVLDTDDETLAAVITRVKKVAEHIKNVLPADGFNILQNNGEAAGQTVKHLHFHIIPRMNGDALKFESGAGDMAELSSLAERMRFNA
jgi:histidine triad (HIT) family protein